MYNYIHVHTYIIIYIYSTCLNIHHIVHKPFNSNPLMIFIAFTASKYEVYCTNA